MKSAVIVVALALGLQLTMGKSMYEKLNKRDGGGDDEWDPVEVTADFTKFFTNSRKNCSDAFTDSSRPNTICAGLSTQVDTVLDSVYVNQEPTPAAKGAIKRALEEISAAFDTEGLTDTGKACVFVRCFSNGVDARFGQGQNLGVCNIEVPCGPEPESRSVDDDNGDDDDDKRIARSVDDDNGDDDDDKRIARSVDDDNGDDDDDKRIARSVDDDNGDDDDDKRIARTVGDDDDDKKRDGPGGKKEEKKEKKKGKGGHDKDDLMDALCAEQWRRELCDTATVSEENDATCAALIVADIEAKITAGIAACGGGPAGAGDGTDNLVKRLVARLLEMAREKKQDRHSKVKRLLKTMNFF